jgi:hypothetical protein
MRSKGIEAEGAKRSQSALTFGGGPVAPASQTTPSAPPARRSRRAPRGRLAVVLGLLLVAIVVAGIAIVTRGGSAGGVGSAAGSGSAAGGKSPASFSSLAASVCARAELAEKALPKLPAASVNETLHVEQAALTISSREIAELKTLRAPADVAPAFGAALADDQELIGLLRSMIARPDYVQLSLTLPRHPNLAPPWLKTWNVRVHALTAEARAKSSQLTVPACEKSLS